MYFNWNHMHFCLKLLLQISHAISLFMLMRWQENKSYYFCDMFVTRTRSWKLLILCSMMCLGFSSFAQQTVGPDSAIAYGITDNSPVQKDIYSKRERWVAAAHIAGYGGSLAGLSILWYSKQSQTSFHFFNDNTQWLQVDKAGHLYSAYLESNASNALWQWAGMPEKKRIWLAGLSGVAYQSIIEVLDGFSSEYGFSTGDFAANIMGSALFVSQELGWGEQKIKIKFSTHLKNYPSPELERRADALFGKSNIERFLKDYNTQTYWLSGNIHSLFHADGWPEWLNIAIGYGGEGMFGGRENIARNEEGQIIFDRKEIKRYRQWYLSPDIDFTRIKTNSKGIKVLLFILNSFKFPAPAFELSNGKLKGRWLVF